MIDKYSYRGDTNLGFYATLTNTYAVLPYEFKREVNVEEKVITTMCGTRLIGLFTAGNSNCLLVPSTIQDIEKKRLDESDINYKILESRDNALGNLILANEKGAVISGDLEEHKEEISDALEVPVIVSTVAGIPNPGVCGVTNKQGVLLHRDATEEEAEKIQEALSVENVDIGTVNQGSPYLGSGMILNDTQFLIGSDTTGPEIGRIDTTLVEHE